MNISRKRCRCRTSPKRHWQHKTLPVQMKPGLSVSIWSNIITRAVHRSITTCAAWRWIRWIIAVTWRWRCWNITVPISRKRWRMPLSALKRAHALNKNPQCGQASLIRASAYERQGQYQQAEEDFWRAVWSGNSKAGGYYGLARLAARNGNFDAGLDFCQQSLRACPTNQEVLCLHNLLLVLSGRQDNARLQREKLLRDYPLNALCGG